VQHTHQEYKHIIVVLDVQRTLNGFHLKTLTTENETLFLLLLPLNSSTSSNHMQL